MPTTARPGHRTPTIRGIAELVQAVPHLLGFHPAESLVILGLERGELVVTARVDLEVHRGVEAVPALLLEHTVTSAAASGAQDFVAVVFSERPDREPPPAGVLRFARPGADECPVHLPGIAVIVDLAAVVSAQGGVLLDAVLVRDGHGRSYAGSGAPAWPLEPTPSPFVVERTVAGSAPEPDRASLAASLEPYAPAPPELAAALAYASAVRDDAEHEGRAARWERGARRALFAACRTCHEPGWMPPPVPDLARYAVALTVAAVRDSVLVAIEDRRLDGRPLMNELARCCPGPYDVTPLFLYGWASWRSGNSMLAGEAASRVLERDPHHHLALTLDSAVGMALDPRRVPRIRRPRASLRPQLGRAQL